MPRTRGLLIVGAVAVLTLAVLAWYRRADFPPTLLAPAHHVVPAPKLADFAAPRAGNSPSVVHHGLAARTSPDYGAQYRHAEDLLAFLEALSPAAAEGDVNALYYLAVASRRCTREYS